MYGSATLAMVLSSDCIKVARTVQIVTMIRFAGFGKAGAAIVTAASSGLLRALLLSAGRASLLLFLLACKVLADEVEHAGRGAQVVVGQADEGGVADLARDGFDLLDDGLATRRQSDGLGPAIWVSLAALDEAGRFKRVEQTHYRGAVESECGGKILLPHRSRRTRDVDQRQPRGLGQAERLQVPIDRAPPLPCRAGDESYQSRRVGDAGSASWSSPIRWHCNIWDVI